MFFNKHTDVLTSYNKNNVIFLLPCFIVQILQSIANHVLFTKEEHMRPFNDFVKSNFDAARR